MNNLSPREEGLTTRVYLIELLVIACVTTVAGLTAASAADEGGAKLRLRALKQGDTVFVRTSFSPANDLIVRVGKGTNRQLNFNHAFLIPAAAGMTLAELSGGRLIHANGDDSVPWNINGTSIGGNHGCSDSRELTCPDHGRTTADLGTLWEDAAGVKYVILKIPDTNRLWVISTNMGQGAIWKFQNIITGTSLKAVGRDLALNITKNDMVQLTPACRIKQQEYLLDGKTPLVDGQPATGDYLDLVEDYDIINPGALVQDLVDHPGVERSFPAGHLAAVINNHITYRFYANGANVIRHESQALQDFNLGFMLFIMTAKLTQGGNYATHDYYIPKIPPFTQDNIKYDFRGLQDYSTALVTPLRFSSASKNIADPQNLPDRFIQFLGRKDGDQTVHEVGFALGYSLIHGLSVPAQRARNTREALMIWTSSKTYPFAIDSKMGNPIRAGTKFDCLGYRQYFYPPAQKNATAFYWHEEGGDTVVYADYHKAVDHEVFALPPALTGKTITVVEKTPSLTLHTDKTVPATGVVLSVTGNYGYVVFSAR